MGSLSPDFFKKPSDSITMADRPKSLVSAAELGDKKKDMKKTDTKELIRLPTADDIAKEKAHGQLNAQIEAGKDLKSVETVEKVHLPTKEEIEAEKAAGEAA